MPTAGTDKMTNAWGGGGGGRGGGGGGGGGGEGWAGLELTEP